MIFDVKTGPGLTRNALLNAANKDAAYRQTELEHEQTLNKYVRPGMSPAEEYIARKRGEFEEQMNPKYWEDETPRRDLSPSSSFISNITVVPSLNLARLRIGNRSYSYPLDEKRTGDLVTNNSIGKYYNQFIKRD